MRLRLIALSDRMYRALLQAYPAPFRERFASEMAQVFQSVCQDAYAEAGAGGVMRLWLSTAWDGLWAVVFQWWMSLLKRRPQMIEPNLMDQRDRIPPLTPVQAGVAVLPFLAFGASSLVIKLEYFHTSPAGLPLWLILLIHPFLVFNWLVLVGLAAGLLAGFPRWTYAFLGWTIYFSWWWTDMGFYGYSSDWRIWLPLLGVFVAVLLTRRSWQVLRALFVGLWRDWTLVALGLYILFGSVGMLSDENHSPFLLLFIAANTLVVAQGAWGFFRSESPLDRVLALIGGLVRMAFIGWVSNTTWNAQAYYGLPPNAQNANLAGMVLFVGLGVVLLGIGLLALWRQRRWSGLRGH